MGREQIIQGLLDKAKQDQEYFKRYGATHEKYLRGLDAAGLQRHVQKVEAREARIRAMQVERRTKEAEDEARQAHVRRQELIQEMTVQSAPLRPRDRHAQGLYPGRSS